MYWFTGDLHFDHENIINHCNRPFKYVDEMNEALITSWNEAVAPGDVVVIVGDFTLHHDKKIVHDKFIRWLNGNIIFLKGNHDYWIPKKEKRYLFHRRINNQYIAAGHFPMRTWQGQRKGGWNLHGHSHGNLAPLFRQLDVGVDVAYSLYGQYRPFSFDEIKKIMEEQEQVYEWIVKGEITL